MKNKISTRKILITSFGNTLEWLDFGVFIFLAPIIGEIFFSSHDNVTNMLAALSVFSLGFICRPLGGIIFGHIGDLYGRANTLKISILMMTVSTLLIGCLPTYKNIGFISPFLFVLLRLIQGISVGGEYSGVMIYLAESAPANRRGFITSFAAIGANLGFLLASLILVLLNNFFSNQTMMAWGWRLPFLLIGLIGSLITYWRFILPETPTFSYLKAKHQLESKPLIAAFKHAPFQLIKIIGLTCMGASLYYVFFGYMPTYMNIYLGMDKNTALIIQSVFLILMLFLVPIAGICGDLFGRKRLLMIVAASVILFSLPCFFLLQFKLLTMIYLSFFIATLLSSFEQGNSLCAIVENCPANVRYSGIAFSFNLGNAIFGGTAPLIVTLLTEKVSLIAPAFYLILMACITFIAAATLLNKANINFYLEKDNV